MKKGKYINCLMCNSAFYISKCFFGKRKFCSYTCANKSFEKENSKTDLKCSYCKKDYQKYSSYLKIRKSKYCSKKCQDLGAMKRTGKLSPLWKGTKESNNRIRKGAKWKKWRTSVFKRDNYTCQDCGNRSCKNNPVILHPHHIHQSAFYPKYRFRVYNGKTLCEPCHKKTHHFKTKESLVRYLKEKLQYVLENMIK